MTVPSVPRLSFVIPVKNGAAHLTRCLASIRRTDAPAGLYEIVVADNGSTDESARVARDAGARVLDLPGMNVASVRNRAAAEAAAGVLAFIDADHEIDPGWPTAALQLLERPEVVAAGAQYDTPSDGNWVQRAYDSFRRRGASTEEVEWLPSGNLAVARAAFERVGGFDTSLETCEDVDLCQRLRDAGGHILSDPRLRSVHRGDPRSLRGIFLGELWRGRDNLRVSLRHRLSWREWPSVLIPVLDLLALAALPIGLLAWPLVGPWVVAGALALVVGFTMLRAASMVKRRPGSVGLVEIVQSLLVAGTYDVARAIALVARGGHAARRRA